MSFLTDLSDKVYGQLNRGWLGGKINDLTGDDYQKHLINTTLTGGIPGLGYGLDYQQAEKEGDSGWNRVGGNALRSAAILSAIAGGTSALGGGGAGGAGSGSAVPVEEAGFQSGSLPEAGGNWVSGTDSAGFGSGQGAGAFNWQKSMGDMLKNMGNQKGQQSNNNLPQAPMLDQGYPQQPQQPSGVYSSAPWVQQSPMTGGLYGLGGLYG